MLTADDVRALLLYDPLTGIFTWRFTRGPRRAGRPAGCVDDTNGYVTIGIENKVYKAHRLAWLYVHGEWPEAYVDHINHDRSDNRIANLRLATRSQNMANSRIHRDNKTGFKGVKLHKESGRYQARITVDGGGDKPRLLQDT